MRKCMRVLAGIGLIAIGCVCFFYPNYREWRTQREVEEFIDSFGQGGPSETAGTEVKAMDGNRSRDPPEDGATVGPGETNCIDDGTEDAVDSALSEIDTEVPEAIMHGVDNRNQMESIADYTKFPELYQAMVRYNADLVDGQSVADAWNYEQASVEFPDIDLEKPMIGYIEIPDMDIRLPLFLGASANNLKEGAAVLSGTSMPIGGEDSNCVIAAHRGWQGSAFFQYIEDLGPGSKVYITTPWETLVYEFRSVKIISPDDVGSILIQEGKDMVTLFTCHPYQLGGGPYRYLVYCDRVGTQTSTIDNGEVVNPEVETDREEAMGSSGTLEKTGGNSSEQNADTYPQTQPVTESAGDTEGFGIYTGGGGVDLIAIEETVRIVLPLAVIAFTIILSLSRFLGRKGKHLIKAKSKDTAKKKCRSDPGTKIGKKN